MSSLLCLGLTVGQVFAAPAVELSFAPAVSAQPFTGRVFVIASKQAISDTPPRLSWFTPYPFFAQTVKGWRPGEVLKFEPRSAFPQPWEKLPEGRYYLQAVLDLDRGGQSALTSAGNGYSKAVELDLRKPPAGPISLVIERVIPARVFKETERVKLFELDSPLLTKFHGRPMRLRAGVVLPKSHPAEPTRRYPVVYEIPGFGGDHFGAFGAEARAATDVAGTEVIHVTLDPTCRLGHHVFADSDNNGPCGRALVEELIPALEKRFRGPGEPRGRLVTGHSSGGWSSLWLQITHPDVFGGCWSTAPDPVDFRDFQRVDLYAPGANLFVDEKGERRPLARRGGKVALYYKPFSDMEVVLGRGGQLYSFEAVFSPKGSDGRPRPLWDRATGAVDADVARAWQRYDIRLVLERNWRELGPKLRGKVHVYMGAEDTFYLEGATRRLAESLKRLGSDAVVEIFPGRDHGSLMTRELRQRVAREMAESIHEGPPRNTKEGKR